MQDIKGEEAELRNTVVDGSVREVIFFLEPLDKIAQFGPGNIFRQLVQDIGKIIQISPDIGRIRFNCMFGEPAERNHFAERIKIMVHSKASYS